MDWIKTTDQLPKLYAPVLTDRMHESVLTPDGWKGGPPETWAYIYDPCRRESQQSISEWGVHTFGKVADSATLVGRALEEYAELMSLLLPDEIGAKFQEMVDSLRARIRTPTATVPASHSISDELADVVVVLMQAAEGYGVDLLGAVDHKMKVNRARKWKTDKLGVGQHE
jgi:NTP pyrophosphatase (non-canonical NTP hydrolase)